MRRIKAPAKNSDDPAPVGHDQRSPSSSGIRRVECDPLRDEGIGFYRLLMQNGVAARCRQVMGTIHGTEIFPIACPEISRDTAREAYGR